MAGVLLDTVIDFPSGAATSGAVAVDADVVLRLGVIAGLVVPIANVVWVVLALKYGVTRERHAEVRRLLDDRGPAIPTI